MARFLLMNACAGVLSLAAIHSAQAGHGCHCPCGTTMTTQVAPPAQVPPAPDAATPAPPPPEGAAPPPAPNAAAPAAQGKSTAEGYQSFSVEPPAAASAPTYTAPAYGYGNTYYGSPRYGSRVDRWMLPKTDPRRFNSR